MSGISSSVGLISGLNTQQIIDSLLQIEAQPKVLAQQRLVQLQTQQAAYLSLNSTLASLKAAAARFGTDKIFGTSTVSTSDSTIATGTATAGALLGSYSLLVDRVVSSQQLLSRGFVDRNATAAGLTSITVESAKARLDADTELARLNGGDGVSRGKILVTDSAGHSTTLDLSRVSNVSDVLAAFNSNQTISVQAKVDGNHLVLTDTAGGTGTVDVRSAAGYTTAASLGIVGTTAAGGSITGTAVYSIGNDTTIQSLNDGNGIRTHSVIGSNTFDFTIKTQDGTTYNVNVGDVYDVNVQKTAGAVTTIAQLKDRIDQATNHKVRLDVNSSGTSLNLVDLTTPNGTDHLTVTDSAGSGAATDLGLAGTSLTGTLNGKDVLASLNSTLAASLHGNHGLAGSDFDITTRSGQHFAFTADSTHSTSTLLASINTATGGAVTAAVNDKGTGIVLTDHTTPGAGNLIVTGTGATALGVATDVAGVAASTVTSASLHRGYITESSLLSSLNGGQGIGTGTFKITGPIGDSNVIISSTDRTVGDLIRRINSATTGTGATARLNDKGDGIIVEPSTGYASSAVKISIADVTGVVARNLNLVGTAPASGPTNFIDGSYERTIALSAADTLDDVLGKVNGAKAGITASVISDGSAGTPYRLQISAAQGGSAGRFVFDVGGADLGLATTSAGADARVFLGADDPARAILVTRSSNTFDGILDGVSLTVKGTSDHTVSLTVDRDQAAIASAVGDFVTAFNTVASKVQDLTAYNPDTDQKGTLLGDGVATDLRSSLFNAITQKAVGVSGQFQYLSEVGLKFNSDGSITLDSDKLQSALQQDPQGVADLFAAKIQNNRPTTTQIAPGISVNFTGDDTYSSLGIAEQIAQFADRYIDPEKGILTNGSRNFDAQITAQNDRIAVFDERIAAKRDILQTQFANLEQTLASLQQQQGALSQLK